MEQPEIASYGGNESLNDVRIPHKVLKSGIDKGYLFVKRVFDICASLCALIALFPVFFIVAVVIAVDDPRGGPFFVQKRCGKNGRQFHLYKFRSMVAQAEGMLPLLKDRNEMSGPVFKIRDDPRITRVGKFLRRTSIDELPQFMNVLKGDMSIIGPRPPLVDEVKYYDAHQRQRLNIKPGLTCFWQVTPKRNSLSFDEWVSLDLKYIRERSVWVDLKLIARTVGVMISGEGQ